jgi:hypothetical protein
VPPAPRRGRARGPGQSIREAKAGDEEAAARRRLPVSRAFINSW